MQVVQTSCAWRSDSTQCFNDNFSKYSFADGIKVSYRNAASDFFFRIYLLMLKAMTSVFLCTLLNENYCLKAKLMETKFIYRVMHVCIEFKLKISDRRKSIPCFFDNPN